MSQRGAIDNYNQMRSRGADAIRGLARVAGERNAMFQQGDQTVSRSHLLDEMAEALSQKLFTIAVVGEFSRGKSTLLNALLGRDNLLPTSILPATAAITVLYHSEHESANIKYADGTMEKDVAVGEIGNYVLGGDLDGHRALTHVSRGVKPRTEKDAEELDMDGLGEKVSGHLRKSKALSPVIEVEVFCNSPFLKDGIRLVDTPGIGSVNPEHGERTRAFIHEADAVIFLINTDPVISASECNFLLFLQDYVRNFLFVITKIDRYTLDEQKASIEYTTKTIKEYSNIKEPRVYPVSARLYTEGTAEKDRDKVKTSGFTRFIQGVDYYLIQERGKLVLQSAVRTVTPHFDDIRRAVDFELQSLALDTQELDRRLEGTREVLHHAIEVRAAIGERCAAEERLLGGYIKEAVDWDAIRSELRAEASEAIPGYEWRELLKANEIIPLMAKQKVGSALEGPLKEITDRLTTFRQEMVEWGTETINRLELTIPFDVPLPRLSIDWEGAFDFDAGKLVSSWKRAETLAIGNSIAVALAGVVLFQGVAVVAMVGGLVAATGITSLLKQRTRSRVEAEAHRSVESLLDRMPALFRAEVISHLTEMQQDITVLLDSAISNVTEIEQQLQKQREGSAEDAAARRIVLEREAGELQEISEALYNTRFWAGHVSGAGGS